MKNKFWIKKNGKKCEVEVTETDKGIKVRTKGKACKEILGKDYYKTMEIGGDFDG